MTLILQRERPGKDGTFGRITGPFGELQTLEQEWMGNRNTVSCIPAGSYHLGRTVYFKHGYETFEVMDVPGRSRILFHPGNTEIDTCGCILLGLRRGILLAPDPDIMGQPRQWKQAVVASREAFRRFMTGLSPVDRADLMILWPPGYDPGPLLNPAPPPVA